MNMRKVLLAVVVCFGVGPAWAADPDVGKLLGKMQKLYDGTTSFSATFEQSYNMVALNRTQKSLGRVAYLKPGKIRFDYTEPMEKTYAVDGNTLWVFQKEDGQALVDRCFKADGLTASLVFLGGRGKIADQFEAALVPTDEKTWGLRLVPREPQSAYVAIVLWVDRKTYEVQRSVVEDPHGNPNTFVFNQVKRNRPMKASDAVFSPPPGVTVNPVPGSCVH
jgi:outer membrane lipoprotein carrier protein